LVLRSTLGIWVFNRFPAFMREAAPCHLHYRCSNTFLHRLRGGFANSQYKVRDSESQR
jgi:hypothetical protein